MRWLTPTKCVLSKHLWDKWLIGVDTLKIKKNGNRFIHLSFVVGISTVFRRNEKKKKNYTPLSHQHLQKLEPCLKNREGEGV
jgi:hypothetical protein